MIWDIVKAFFEAGLRGVREVREAKKTELEIQKLEDEKKERKSVIEKVSTEDVQKYDPKQAALHRSIVEKSRPGIVVAIITALVAILALYLLSR